MEKILDLCNAMVYLYFLSSLHTAANYAQLAVILFDLELTARLEKTLM